jgi:lipopolysaccharide transport system permease protein
MSFYSSISGSLSSGGSLILQVNFPHEALVAQQMAQSIANFLISLLMISLVFIIFGIRPNWQVLFFPLMLVPILLIGAALGMVVAVITVVVHDINKMVSVALGFLMFLTPIVYAQRFQNEMIQKVIVWNPMTYLIGNARDIILYGRFENLQEYFLSCLLAAVLFFFSWRLFFLSEHKVAEKL